MGTDTGRALGRLEGHRTYVTALLFWPDGQTLASASTDQTVRLWDVQKFEPVRTLRGHELEVHSLALLPDTTTLVSGAKDGAVFIWDTGAPPARKQLRLEPVTAWRFTPDSEAIVALDPTGKVTRWHGRDFEESELMLEIARQSPGPPRAALAADVPLIAVSAERGTVQIFNWKERRLVNELATGVRNVSVVGFTEAGRKLLLAYEGAAPKRHELHEWDIERGNETRSWGVSETSSLQFVAAPNGNRAMIRQGDGAVILIDLETGLERPMPFVLPPTMGMSLSPDGMLFAAASSAGWAKVWDIATSRQIAELSGFILGVHSVGFSPDGRRLITGSGGGEAVRVWDGSSFEALLTLGAQGTLFRGATFSPDGNVIGARNGNGRLYLWRAPSWQEIEAAERAGAR